MEISGHFGLAVLRQDVVRMLLLLLLHSLATCFVFTMPGDLRRSLRERKKKDGHSTATAERKRKSPLDMAASKLTN